jgi:hypothetical protein
MKFSFQTPSPFKQQVVLDRALITGKVKVTVDGALLSPSHRGKRGAAGTFYQVRGGVLEIRSGPLDLVPQVWFNEDWIQLAPPMKSWEWLVAGLPLVPGIMMLGLDSFLISFVAFFLNLVIMRSGRPAALRVAFCVATTFGTLALVILVRIGLSMLTGQQ